MQTSGIPVRLEKQQLKVGDIVIMHLESPRELRFLARVTKLCPVEAGLFQTSRVLDLRPNMEIPSTVKPLYSLEQGESDSNASDYSPQSEGTHNVIPWVN